MASPCGDALWAVKGLLMLQIHNSNSPVRSLICFCSCAAGKVTDAAGEGAAIVRRVGQTYKRCVFRQGTGQYI